MFEQAIQALNDTIDALDIPIDGAALAACVGLLDKLNAKITTAVGAFDAAEAWRDSGATSMTAWLRANTRRSGRDASACVRTARRLADLPVLAEAYRSGVVSTAQVQAVVANLNDETAPLFGWTEADLVPTLASLSVTDVSNAMQHWAQAAKDSLHDPTNPEPDMPERRLHLSHTLDGRRELTASLDAEAGALVETALRLAQTDDCDSEPPRTPAQRRADALVDIARFYLDHQQTRRGGRHRPHLNIHIDYRDLATARPAGRLLDGTVLDGATIRRLACDAGIHRVVTDGRSSILDYGHTTRTVPANLYNALVVRDHHCRFPHCDRPPQFCEAHHIQHWEHGGPTRLDNLVLLCSRHHHLLHNPGWTVQLQPDGNLTIGTPEGRNLHSRPPGKPPDLYSRSWELALT